jgi:hypothetical protein
MKFNLRFEQIIKDKGEVNNGENHIDMQGYIDTEQQVLGMIQAGQRLVDYRSSLYRARAGAYHFQDGETIPEDFIDPTLNPDYDLVDAQNDMKRLDEKWYDSEKLKEEVAKQRQEELSKEKEKVKETAPEEGQ